MLHNSVSSRISPPSMYLRHSPLAALAALAALAVAAACFVSPCAASPDSVVVFNEIHYNPAGQAEAGEWVELFNQIGIKTDISGWRIDGIGYTFPANTIVNPGAYVDGA